MSGIFTIIYTAAAVAMEIYNGNKKRKEQKARRWARLLSLLIGLIYAFFANMFLEDDHPWYIWAGVALVGLLVCLVVYIFVYLLISD